MPDPTPIPPTTEPSPEEPTPMLDIHPPHHTPNTWRDFFIHIATITVGLLIAIGLEQSVEAIHHHHQQAELVDQMRAESELNLATVDASQQSLQHLSNYVDKLQQSLAQPATAANTVNVAFPPYQAFKEQMIVSASRGTWTAAKAAGLVALLPPQQVKLYARLDYNAEESVRTEDVFTEKMGAFESACERAGLGRVGGRTVQLTVAQRDDLVFYLDQVRSSLGWMRFRWAIEAGALQAIANGVHSLDQMYPYQNAAILALHMRKPFDKFVPATQDDPTSPHHN